MSDLLSTTLTSQNKINVDDLIAPLEINYGDEIAGLFKTPAKIPEIVDEIRHTLQNHIGFRYVVTYGRIGFAASTLREMGGPVFDQASKALLQLKKDKQFARWQLGRNPYDAALTALSNAAHTLISRMSSYQYEVYRLHRDGLAGVDIADQLGRDPRSVSNAKRSSHADIVIQSENALAGLAAIIENQEERLA